MTPENTHTRDHPQTIKGEDDARRADAPATDESGASSGGGASEQREEASPLGNAHSQLSADDAEAVRRHAQGGRSIGGSIRSTGLDVGAGTPSDKGDLGGGDPQV